MDIAFASQPGASGSTRRPAGRALVVVVALATALALVPPDAAAGQEPPSSPPEGRSAIAPTAAGGGQAVPVRVRTRLDELDIPWDVAVLPSGAMLVTERTSRRLLLRRRNGTIRVLSAAPSGTWAEGETGLMSVVLDPGFVRNRRFYTCHGGFLNDNRDVRVVAWRMADGNGAARRVKAIVTGIPVSSGRHGGCRLEFARNGALFVGTGDAARTAAPQNLRSLGGKVLRVRRFGGGPFPGNPYEDAASHRRRLVFTHGHRNVQGLAQRPGGSMWSVEHGPSRDDEVNLLVSRGDYGWQPGQGYDESVPMTDFSLPGPQRAARWSSGSPTLATSGAVWLAHRRWGAWEGALAVASLKDESLHVMQFDGQGRVTSVTAVAELDATYGRLRSARLDERGALYLTTSNGGGLDRVLRVVPR